MTRNGGIAEFSAHSESSIKSIISIIGSSIAGHSLHIWKAAGKVAVAAAAAVAVLTTSACSFGLGGDNTQSNASTDTVNIAAIYPETGQYVEYGKLFKRGWELALDEVNADGGVQGKKLGIKYFDTQSDAKQDDPRVQEAYLGGAGRS